MSVKERILTIRLLEKLSRQPKIAGAPEIRGVVGPPESSDPGKSGR